MEFPKSTTYYVYQREEGASGTPHLQGYFELARPQEMRWLKARGFKQAHLEIAKGTADQNKAYCTKEPRLSEPVEWGVPGGQGKRNDLAPALELCKEQGAAAVAEKYPEQYVKYTRGMQALEFESRGKKRKAAGFIAPSIIVYWGQTGAGKTRRAYEEYPDLFRCVSHTGGTLWMDGYRGEEVVLFDDFQGGIQFRLLLQIMDGYPLHLQIKGGHVIWQATTIIFTSNVNPENWYQNAVDEKGLDISPLRRRLEDFGHVELMMKE